MFKKELKISAVGEKFQLYVVKCLNSLHVNFNVVGEGRRYANYYMKVSKKQLRGITKYIIPMEHVYVSMNIYNHYFWIQ